jgi:hypothetical protein
MAVLELRGRITKKGKLKVQLPEGLPAGEVTVRIEVPVTDWADQPWTEEEIHEMMKPQPKTGAEIAAMIEQMGPIELVDAEITDPVEWVKAQRQKDADRLKPYWDGEK